MERRVAKAFGGVRLWRPDFGDSIPDGEAAHFTWDAKAYASHAAVSLYVENEKKYRDYTGDRRTFLLILFSRKHPKRGDFVVLPLSKFTEIATKAGMM